MANPYLKRVWTRYGGRRRLSGYEYKGWVIASRGGFCTMKHFVAQKNELWHWAFKLAQCLDFCDQRDNGLELNPLYLKGLYG